MANNLQDLITALFDFATHGGVSESLSETTLSSLETLGKKQPKIFLNSVHTFLLHNSKKMSEKDKAFVFSCLAAVLADGKVLQDCDDQQILLIVNLSTQEMSMAKDIEHGLAAAAKEVLVTLAAICNKFVIDSLLSKFQPGSSSPPHRYVIITLSEIAAKNPAGFVPFLHDILARTGALLPHIKNDQIRSALAQSICAFCESVKEFAFEQKKINNVCENGQREEDEMGTEDEIHENFADQFETAYDVVINWPTSSKDHKCRADAAECIGTLCLMIQKSRILKDLKKLDSLFRSLHKKAYTPEEQLAIATGIANFLQASCPEDTIPIEHYINDIFEMLFPHVCLITEQNLMTDDTPSPNMLQIKIRNEVFRAFQVSSCRSADKEIYFLLHKMQSQNETVKLGAINLLRHLLNSADDHMKENRSLITMGLKPFLVDDTLPTRVKMCLCQLCIALADNEYVQADEAGQQVMQFLLTNLIFRSDPTLLWPLLFEYVCIEQYSSVITDIFKCLRILCGRIRESTNKLEPPNFESNPKLPGPAQLMSRLIVFMNGAPLNQFLNSRAKETLQLFGELNSWFHEKFGNNLFGTKLSTEFLAKLENEFPCTNSSSNGRSKFAKNRSKDDYAGMEFKSTRIQRWQALVLEMLCTLIDVVEDQEWRQCLAAAQAKQMGLFTSMHPDAQQSAHDKAFLMRCLGCTLARIQCPNFVKEHLYLLFRQTTHSITAERVGCAMALGHSASILDHTDLVLTELENVSKWEHMKEKKGTTGGSSAGILSFIKDSLPYGRSVDIEILNLRATIMLSFGYVVFYCPTEGLVLRLERTILPFLRQYTATSKEALLREAHLETLNLIAVSVHPNRLRDYRFESRYECLSYIKEYVNEEKSPETLSSWIRLLAAKATASLVVLDPPLSENEFLDISNVLVQNIFPICRERSGLKTLNTQCLFGFTHIFLPPKKRNSPGPAATAYQSGTANHHRNNHFTMESNVNGKAKIDDDEASTVMEATVIQCRNAIANIVRMRPSVKPTINELTKLFYQYYGSERDHERARAIDFTVLTLQVYSEKADDCTLGVAKEFSPLSWLLGRLSPRLCDSLAFVRLQSLHGIWLAFKLSLLHRGHSPLDTDLVDSSLFDVNGFVETHFGGALEGRLDTNKCSAAILAIAKEIEKRLPQSQVQTYLLVLFKMLSDRQSNVSSAAAQLLRSIISDRANSLHKEAEVLLINLLGHLSTTRPDKIQTYTELLNGFTLFSAHHLTLAIRVLLRQSLPYNQTLSEVWEMMARVHFVGIIDYLLELSRNNNNPGNKQQSSRPLSTSQQEIGVEANEATGITESPTHSQQLSPTQNELARGMGGAHSPHFSTSHFELINIGGGSVIKVVSDEACALICALTEVIKKGEPEDELTKRVPLIIVALLQMLVSLVDTQYSNAQKNATIDTSSAASTSTAQTSTLTGKREVKGKPIIPIVTAELTRTQDLPAKLVTEAIKSLMVRINAGNVTERMNTERAWTNLTSQQHFISAISSFCLALLDFRPHFVGSLISIESDYLRGDAQSINEAERISAAAVVSSLITRCPRENGEFDSTLFCTSFHALEEALHDPNLVVRKLAVYGLGRINQLKGPEAEDLILRFSQRSIEAAMAGLDDHGDRQDQLATEAIASLDNLVRVSQPSLLMNVLPQLLLKIRPCFEKENSSLRAFAFSLFSGLGFAVGSCETFRESLHSNIISIVLHLNDDDEAVRISCAKLLHTCVPLINSEHASALIEHEMPGGRVPPNYPEFLRQFGIILPLSFPDRLNTYALDCNNYFRSMSSRIRSNAVLLMGFMLTALTAELRATLSKDLIFNGLLQLLKDPDEQVRLNTVTAISLLHDFA